MHGHTETISPRHHTWDDILHDQTWTRAITIRWSDPNDRGENISDIAAETLSYEDPADPDVIAATLVIKLIVDRAPVAQLRALGVVQLTMTDVEPGMRGRIGWAFVRGATLVLVVLHSAFEDDIPGDHLDDGRNAHTELQLAMIRSRIGAEARYAFSSRLARNRRNRLDIVTALQRYGWRLFLGGKETDFDDPILEGVQAAFDEKKTREFHQSSGKGELDDLMDNLYPRNGSGLPFTHQFVHTTVDEGGRTFVKIFKKQVEGHADAVARMQLLAPMIAAGQPWCAVGERAGSLAILAKGASDIKHSSGRTIADLTWKGTAIKRVFTHNHELFTTGIRTTRWHGKIQGGAEYGKHGKPQSYTLPELKAMTALQRKKAEKGYFVVSLNWGVPMLPDTFGDPCPYGVPWATWALMAKRYEQEAAVTRTRGGADQHRDKKPLVGPHEWVVGENRYAIVTNRLATYELHTRDHLITGGWKGHPGRTLAVWRSEDHHRSLGESTADLAGRLGDKAAALVLTRAPDLAVPVQTKRMRLLAEANSMRVQASSIKAQVDAIPELARILTAEGMTAQALEQYAAAADLHKELERLRQAGTAAEAAAAAATDSEPNRQARAEFATIKAVAAGLLAYSDKAPYRLKDACSVLYHDHRAELINDGLSIRWTVTVHVTLEDRSVGTHQLSGVVPNRRRSQSGANPETYDRVARLWFTSPTAVSFEDLATHLGWQADEVRRKVAVWLGYRAIPKHLKMPVRIVSRGLRSALLDCPLAEVRHAMWAALVPAERQVADYLPAPYRDHVAATYLDPTAVWVLNWAADTHIFRRRLMDLCLQQPQRAVGVRIDAAAAALAIGETDIATFSRDYKINPRRNGSPAYPATFERVIPFGRYDGSMPPEKKRVRPLRCPHPDCEGRKGARTGGWCTTILRVPELAQWAVLCPDCRRVPDLTKADLRFPLGYFTPWVGPRGFASGRGGERTTRGTVAIDPGAHTV